MFVAFCKKILRIQGLEGSRVRVKKRISNFRKEISLCAMRLALCILLLFALCSLLTYPSFAVSCSPFTVHDFKWFFLAVPASSSTQCPSGCRVDWVARRPARKSCRKSWCSGALVCICAGDLRSPYRSVRRHKPLLIWLDRISDPALRFPCRNSYKYVYFLPM